MSNDDYRALVGPAALYDEIGFLQFALLVSLGMRSNHTLCDVGCGTLRLGRLAIPYLEHGNYYGIEPDENKLSAGIKHEVGNGENDTDIFRQPLFSKNNQFDLSIFNQRFDYIIAHSIFSHAPQAQIKACFASVAETLAPAGVFAFTYFPGGKNYTGKAWAPKARYQAALFKGIAERHSLRCQEIAWYHPKKQRWMIAFPAGTMPKLDYRLSRA